jgi:23S rRNA A2030 N6-methylase RlmJ
VSNYTPVYVTASNFEWAIRENMRRIDRALRTKLHVSDARPLRAAFNLNNKTLQNVEQGTSEFSAATYGQALNLLSLSALLLIEGGDGLTDVEDGDELKLY